VHDIWLQLLSELLLVEKLTDVDVITVVEVVDEATAFEVIGVETVVEIVDEATTFEFADKAEIEVVNFRLLVIELSIQENIYIKIISF
jgi:hypothetical protein